MKRLFFSRVYLNREGIPQEYLIESIRPYKNFFILKFKGINTITQAKELVGLECMVEEHELTRLEEDKYYLFQIIGSSVFTESDERIGIVNDVLHVKGNDLLVIDARGKEILIPFTSSICVSVDPEKRKIVLKPPEGLLDLNEI